MADINIYISRLSKLFNDKHWSRLFDDLGFDDILPNFLNIIVTLSDEEAELILTLTEDYLYLDANSLERKFRDIYNAIGIDLLLSYENIYFLPLRDHSDGKRNTKSSSSVHYPAYHRLRNMSRGHREINIESYDLIDVLGDELKNREKCLIIFVDDFIGSGKTALNALTQYKNKFHKKFDEVAVMCAICQEEGFDKVTKAGFDVWPGDIRMKGISDSTRIPDTNNALNIMRKISSRLTTNKNFHLGFESSEALVTMPFRTPNNTFPVYWMDNNTWKAPFYR